ncbi:MAG: hypothetical protein JRI55_38335 [Deltaproteobacteria bacterium]|jgi:hypothetical protein|nr:hypothetical protein [Deltaproteobacteria bacterium]
MKRKRRAAIVALLLPTALVACTLVSDFSGLTGATGGSGAAGSGGSGDCGEPSDCPEPANDCLRPICVDGTCGTSLVGAGVPTPSQVPGDCRLQVCDGAGQTTQAVDDTDLPDAGGACQQGTCTDGSVGAQLAPVGTECNPSKCEGPEIANTDTCDDAGSCVDQGVLQDCTPYACFTNTSGDPECRTSCTAQQDCAPGYDCSGGSCS